MAPESAVPRSMPPLEVASSAGPSTWSTVMMPSAPVRRSVPSTRPTRAEPDLKSISASPATCVDAVFPVPALELEPLGVLERELAVRHFGADGAEVPGQPRGAVLDDGDDVGALGDLDEHVDRVAAPEQVELVRALDDDACHRRGRR